MALSDELNEAVARHPATAHLSPERRQRIVTQQLAFEGFIDGKPKVHSRELSRVRSLRRQLHRRAEAESA